MLLFGDALDGQDNWFRPGIKTAERGVLALEVFAGSELL